MKKDGKKISNACGNEFVLSERITVASFKTSKTFRYLFRNNDLFFFLNKKSVDEDKFKYETLFYVWFYVVILYLQDLYKIAFKFILEKVRTLYSNRMCQE